MGTPDRSESHRRAREADPWDLQGSREAYFRSKLAEKASDAKFENLDDILDEMRMVKSPREIALLRESSHIAGLTMMEAMRSAEPGMYEYEIEAIGDYLFKAHNAQGPAYFGLVAAGKNAAWPHYHAAQSQTEGRRPGAVRLRARLSLLHVGRDADVPRQRQVQRRSARALRHLREAVPGDHDVDQAGSDVADIPRDRRQDGRGRWRRTRSGTDRYKAAAARFVDGYRARANSTSASAPTLGHMVGMEVHDVQHGLHGSTSPGWCSPSSRR